ncbi:MAG: flagellar basal body-associated FliL family protein [Bdellovibrionota bacterium]
MADDKNTAEKSSDENEASGKRKKIILIAIIALALVGIGVGAFFFLKSPANENSETATSEEHEESVQTTEKKEDKESKEEQAKEATAKEGEEGAEKSEGEGQENSNEKVEINFGQTYTLKTFHLNLGNPLENRYVKLDISLEYKGGDAQRKEIEARIPQLRDAVVNVASKKTREFLLGPDGKDQLRLEILNRINQYMDRKIESVYITDILIE